jgi:hypothetical protein
MDKNGNKLSNKTELPIKLKLENTMDASGRWFTVAVLFVVLADDIRTASNDTLPPPASSSR